MLAELKVRFYIVVQSRVINPLKTGKRLSYDFGLDVDNSQFFPSPPDS